MYTQKKRRILVDRESPDFLLSNEENKTRETEIWRKKLEFNFTKNLRGNPEKTQDCTVVQLLGSPLAAANFIL